MGNWAKGLSSQILWLKKVGTSGKLPVPDLQTSRYKRVPASAGEDICFPECPAAEEVYKELAQGGLCVVKALGIEGVEAHVLACRPRGHQTYGEQDHSERAKGILVVTGVGSSPCPLENLKLTLDSITLNEMQVGLEEQLFINAKDIRMPAPGQAWSTKAFLVGG